MYKRGKQNAPEELVGSSDTISLSELRIHKISLPAAKFIPVKHRCIALGQRWVNFLVKLPIPHCLSALHLRIFTTNLRAQAKHIFFFLVKKTNFPNNQLLVMLRIKNYEPTTFHISALEKKEKNKDWQSWLYIQHLKCWVNSWSQVLNLAKLNTTMQLFRINASKA